MAMTLPRGSILAFDGNALTEHNRGNLNVDIDRIESAERMANGSMRKYVIADKKRWSVSWDGCPSDASKTVDGKWGGIEIHNFYNTVPGVFVLTIKSRNTTETYNAFISEFSYDVVKRGVVDLWNISLTVEEA